MADIVVTGAGHIIASPREGEPVPPRFRQILPGRFGELRHRASKLLKQRAPVDRASVLAINVGDRVLRDAGCSVCEENAASLGLVVGVGLGTYETIAEYYTGLLRDGAAFGSPNLFVSTVANAVAGWTSIALGIKGYSLTVAQGALSGACALDAGIAALTEGHVEAVLVLAASTAGAYTERSILGFPGTNEGFTETAAALLVETEAAARRRGARCLGTIDGVIQSSAASADRQVACAAILCNEACIAPDRVTSIFLGGGGTERESWTRVHRELWQRAFPAAAVLCPSLSLGSSFSAWGILGVSLVLSGDASIAAVEIDLPRTFLVNCHNALDSFDWAGILATRLPPGPATMGQEAQ